MDTNSRSEFEQRVCDLYESGLVAREVGLRCGKCAITIRKILRKCGVTVRGKGPVHPHRFDIVRDFQNGVKPAELCVKYKVGFSTIRSMVMSAGLRYLNRSEGNRRYALNENAFGIITNESAYWIGFLLADGSVSSTELGGVNDSVRVNLKGGDSAHLEKLRNFMGSEVPVKFGMAKASGKSYPFCSILISSRTVVNSLVKWGVTPNKSLTATVHADLRMNRHTIRGLIDGDGTLAWNRKRKGGQDSPVLVLCGSSDVCQAFADFTSANGTSKPTPYKRRNIWDVRKHGLEAVNLARVLYQNGDTCLERKRAEAERFQSYAPITFFDWSSVTREQLLEVFNRLGSWDAVANEIGAPKTTLKVMRSSRFGIFSRDCLRGKKNI